ncbi:hypothetical protein [Micromonospora sp. C95]|uniref:hypothetical protein n=1 Tax=Micromonospora sp. C95 TaxID=2824882 RepID=UPI0026575CE3|nr:hypothetical protein [Micromonospora sp. C95]
MPDPDEPDPEELDPEEPDPEELDPEEPDPDEEFAELAPDEDSDLPEPFDVVSEPAERESVR